jgi:hypothetical protein
MTRALQYSSWAVGLWLNLMVISVLLRGVFRQYPFVLAYSVATFVSTIIEISVQSASDTIKSQYYWTNEVILEVLVFCVVIAFIDDAAQHSKHKILERHWLILAALLIAIVSFAFHRSPHLNRQMTLMSRDLNICAVVLDLILWSLLVKARRPDRSLLLLSGGLGIQLTGAIMGGQLMHASNSLYPVGVILEVVTGFLGTYIWWRALRLAPAIKKGGLQQEPTR